MFKILVDFTMKRRSFLANCKRKASISKKDFLYHHSLKFDDYRVLLMENLGLKANDARKVLYYQQSIFAVSQEHIVERCQLCRKLQIDPSTLFKNAELLCWPSRTLRHRALLLREMGVSKMHAAMVSNFMVTMSLRMGIFKAYMGIPKAVNVADNLLQCLHKPPPSVPPLEALSENLTVNDYHKQCLRWYIQWRLNVSKDDEEMIKYLVYTMKHKSFTTMRKLFDTLHYDIGLTIEQIKKYSCLSAGTGEDLVKIVNEIQRFGGLDIKKIIKQNPVMHSIEYKNVVAVIRTLEEHGISSTAMRRCPKILMLNSNKIASRLKALEDSPELRVLKNNVKVLLLIYRFGAVQTRLEYLRYINVKHVTVRNLTGEHLNFERFIRTGVDKTKGRELGYSLEKTLKLDATEIYKKIRKHRYWRHVDLLTIQDTLNFLLERFAPEDLHDSLQILLYPREKIKEILESLPEVKPNKPKEIVAICLYEIEREHNFSGDGVWIYDAPLTSRTDSLDTSLDAELSDVSDNETAAS